MEYTQEQLADFKLEATRRRQRAFVVVGLATILLLGLAVIFKQIGKGGGLWAILWVLWVAFVFGYTYRTWRCPACGSFLGRRTTVKFCPQCGVALQ
jgi:hypothetical protein